MKLDSLGEYLYKHLNWSEISRCCTDITFLSSHKDKLIFYQLLKNVSASSSQLIEEQISLYEHIHHKKICYCLAYNYTQYAVDKLTFLVNKYNIDLIELENLDDEFSDLFYHLSENPFATDMMIDQYPHKICFYMLASNTNRRAVEYFISNVKNETAREWNHFSQNSCKEAINFLTNNPKYIRWYYLIQNPSAAALIKEHIHFILMDNIYRTAINYNTNPEVIEILYEHPSLIKNYCLQSNETQEAFELYKCTAANKVLSRIEVHFNPWAWREVKEKLTKIYNKRCGSDNIFPKRIYNAIEFNPNISLILSDVDQAETLRLYKSIIEKTILPTL